MTQDKKNRVVFYSSYDLSGIELLSKGEKILNKELRLNTNNINDVLELHHIKCYLDNNIYLKNWSKKDIFIYKEQVKIYGKIVGKFISNINNTNILKHHKMLIPCYIESFWLLINNQKAFKKISSDNIVKILFRKSEQIWIILKFKNLVEQYNNTLRDFLLTYQQSAEIILSVYEIENNFNNTVLFLPSSLTKKLKENIISNYIDSENINTNYLPIIQNSKKHSDFFISDKIRLKAKRKYSEEINKVYDGKLNGGLIKYGVSINYDEKAEKIKELELIGQEAFYTYNLKHIKEHNNFYCLYLNFKSLFEFIDIQNRINLVSKPNLMGLLEKNLGVRSKTEYRCGLAFHMSEMASHAQIFTYSKVLKSLDCSIEKIIQLVYCSTLTKQYSYATNARLAIPSEYASALEKVRILAPELEYVLKQYKLFVENNEIDFELLQISSNSTSIKDIPSLNEKKYIYLNNKNQEIVNVSHLFFSDQTLLTDIEPYKEKYYQNLFELLINEQDVCINNYDKYQINEIQYLLDKGYLFVDEFKHIKISDYRVLILNDLYENDFSSFYHYNIDMQETAITMHKKRQINFESSLFAKPEQDYFNYYLNKNSFTNGLDLRNSYLHGSQANPSETNLHEESYLIYLKLLTLVVLKIEDDLLIKSTNK